MSLLPASMLLSSFLKANYIRYEYLLKDMEESFQKQFEAGVYQPTFKISNSQIINFSEEGDNSLRNFLRLHFSSYGGVDVSFSSVSTGLNVHLSFSNTIVKRESLSIRQIQDYMKILGFVKLNDNIFSYWNQDKFYIEYNPSSGLWKALRSPEGVVCFDYSYHEALKGVGYKFS